MTKTQTDSIQPDLTWVQILALTLTYLGFWAVVGRYYGLQHDAQVYVVQALAVLRPEIFLGDLYLKFGSQDDFTLFSNFCAPFIAVLGVDHGAAVLTFCFHLLWTIGAWLLVRHLTDARTAWLAIGLLLVLPGWYGAGHVFEISERFLSARLPAEALCLLAFVAMIRGRPLLTTALLALALVTHPLMTMPAVLVVALAWLLARTPFSLLPIWCIALTVLCILAGWILGGSTSVITGDWLDAVRSRSSFLFLDLWTIDDWHSTLLVLATLAIAACFPLTDTTRRLVAASLCIAVVGLLASAFTSLLVPLKLVLQGQPWRWIWIGTFMAISLLPSIWRLLWAESNITRAACLLLATAWLADGLGSEGSILTSVRGLLAWVAFAILVCRRHLLERHAALILYGAWSALVGCILLMLAIVLAEAGLDFDFGGDPVWVQRVGGLLMTPSVGAVLVVAAWAAVLQSRSAVRAAAVTLLGSALLVGAAPQAWATWSHEAFGTKQQNAFADWRNMIEPDQEVLWPDGLRTTWFVLERRSYLTLSQLGGIVFSKEATTEARRRAAALADVFPPGSWFNEPAKSQPDPIAVTGADLRKICSVPDVAFFVSTQDLGNGASRAEWPRGGAYVYLYDCASVGRAGQ